MVLTVTEDTPADMLAGSMELLVQMPRNHHVQTQRVTVQRSTPMMDLLVQIATAHKLTASNYTLEAIGERGLVLPHQPNTPIGALDALQVKLLPKQGTFLARKSRQTNQPFETTFRLQVHLPRNQLYVSRVSPKMNLGEILDEVCREKNLDQNKYELRHPANLVELLDLNLTLEDYHLQEVTLCPRQQDHALSSTLSSQDIMALQKQEECRRQQARQSVFGFFKKSKENSFNIDSLGNRNVSPAHNEKTTTYKNSNQQLPQQQLPAPPSRPQRKRRPAPKPPVQQHQQNISQTFTQTKTTQRPEPKAANETSNTTTSEKDKIIISHSRNSSDSSGYHEASVLSDNPDNSAGRMPETLPRRGRMQGILESPRKLAHTSQTSKSLGNLAMALNHEGTLSRGISNSSLSFAGQKKKRIAPLPPIAQPLPSAISTQGLERIVDSDESLTSDMDLSKPSSDIDVGVFATGCSKTSSDITCHVNPIAEQSESVTLDEQSTNVESARVIKKEPVLPIPKPRKIPKQPMSPSATLVESSLPDANRASLGACSGSSSLSRSTVENTSFGLPSLTEDEREAIDSIVQAANEFESLKSESSENDKHKLSVDDDFVEAPLCPTEEINIVKKVDKDGDVYDECLNVSATIKDENDDETNKLGEMKIPEHDMNKIQEINIKEICAGNIEKMNFDKATDDHMETNDFKFSSIKTNNSVTIETENEPKETLSEFEEEKLIEFKNKHPNEEYNLRLNENEDKKIKENQSTVKEVKFKFGMNEEKDKEDTKVPFCAVISTIPKCDHLEPYNDNDFNKSTDNSELIGTKKRGKIVRSQSEMSHFDVGPAEKHSRHLTSNGEAFTFALNPNLGDAATRSIEASIAATGKASSMETDILLQKVSDTLSHSLTPPSPPPTPEDTNLGTPNFVPAIAPTDPPKGFENTTSQDDSKRNIETIIPGKISNLRERKKDEKEKECMIKSSEEASLEPNLILGLSQQDTSDYVSASGEDLSITDWEYQIPAPPSAFRDDDNTSQHQQKLIIEQNKDRIIKETISVEAEVHRNIESSSTTKPTTLSPIQQKRSTPKNFTNTLVTNNESKNVQDSTLDVVDCSQTKALKFSSTQFSPEIVELKKAEIISELETKINNNKPIVEPIVLRDELYAPKIAPVENNLSNFTITTYTRQKSMDIFEQTDQQHDNNRILNTFATLTRGRSIASDFVNDKRPDGLKNAYSMERMSENLIGERAKIGIEGTEIYREKPVHRSKSYITLTSNEKFQIRSNGVEKSEDGNKIDNHLSAKKNDEIPKHKEKFSQWRDNILKKQQEPTKEKQLQSLQVLKSILPQLKNAQGSKEIDYKSSINSFNANKSQEPGPRDSSVSTVNSEVHLRKNRRSHEPAKRYTYGGPPSVSFSSWSERPYVNVQIKNDTDYKFGGSKNSASGARTVVNLNTGASEANEIMHIGKVMLEKKELERETESHVDTSSVSFKELTKTFGQNDDLTRSKPPVTTRTHRHFEFLERSKSEINPKQNGFVDSHTTTTSLNFNNVRTPVAPSPSIKRYTSVIGITNNYHNNNNNNDHGNNNSNNTFKQTNLKFVNGQTTSSAVKGCSQKEKEFVVPKPPTMPIITGVTLKSVNAGPKSSPPATQTDPRDQLLESIRNFGGRQKLKSVANRY